MNCPNCPCQALAPTALEPGLIAAGCQTCGGTLLPLMNYRYWLDHNPQLNPQNCEAAHESPGAKICPKCSKLMTKYLLGVESKNRLDLCAHCDEVWLDAGEWVLVREMNLHTLLPKVFTDAWQKNIRHQRQAQKLREHYVTMMGEQDFAKVEAFKSWLDAHPHAADIKHYVTAKLS